MRCTRKTEFKMRLCTSDCTRARSPRFDSLSSRRRCNQVRTSRSQIVARHRSQRTNTSLDPRFGWCCAPPPGPTTERRRKGRTRRRACRAKATAADLMMRTHHLRRRSQCSTIYLSRQCPSASRCFHTSLQAKGYEIRSRAQRREAFTVTNCVVCVCVFFSSPLVWEF